MDNVFIERLWRSLKYESVHLHVFENGTEARWDRSLDKILRRKKRKTEKQKNRKTVTTEAGGLTTIEPSLLPPPCNLTNGDRPLNFSSSRNCCLGPPCLSVGVDGRAIVTHADLPRHGRHRAVW
jgi:hypothetical protein